MQTVDEALAKLQKSKFRSGFHLDEKNVKYIDEKGFDVIRCWEKARACRNSQ